VEAGVAIGIWGVRDVTGTSKVVDVGRKAGLHSLVNQPIRLFGKPTPGAIALVLSRKIAD
jgi:hypothetical protein